MCAETKKKTREEKSTTTNTSFDDIISNKIFFFIFVIYRFSIDSRFNHFKQKAHIAFPGATHADELCYLFRFV